MSLTIKVEFLGGLTPGQESVFMRAAERWMSIITEDLSPVRFGGEVFTGVKIFAQGQFIDGDGGPDGLNTLGQAGPRFFRNSNGLPAVGLMQFDTFDLARLEEERQLEDVIIHEMGHVLGIGTLWENFGLIFEAPGNNPVFLGRAAAAEWSALIGSDQLLAAPVANQGGPGSRGGHWRESELLNELMSPIINEGVNPLSRLSIASLQDLGYTVDLNAADSFQLPSAPNLVAFAEDIGRPRKAVRCSCGSTRRQITPVKLPPEAERVG